VNINLDLQLASDCSDIPSLEDMQAWLNVLMSEQHMADKEIAIRVVDGAEIQQLNKQFRGKDKTTNVLSFPFEMPDITFPNEMEMESDSEMDMQPNFLGDIVICAPVVKQEAIEQNKALPDHWTHMLVHGTLHLMGYDHIEEQDANEMEGIEIAVLKKLGIDDPYQDH
jgi:probable rRNA maturation factor